ncbi:hypothetical protein Peur_063611 [Populus x canadensis]
MDEEYDVIVQGTGLKKCILSGFFVVDGLKVLHMNRNDYYKGESTSLNLNKLWKRFRGSNQPPVSLGASKEYNIDMTPKFIIANGCLLYVLIHTDVTKFLNFKVVDGSFVYNKGKSFARLSVIYGGTYILNKPEYKVEFDESEKAIDMISEGETTRSKKLREGNAEGRWEQLRGYLVEMKIEIRETKEMGGLCAEGIDLLGLVNKIFYDIYDRYMLANNEEDDNCFIYTSYDATTHFETTVQDVIAMYSKITGKQSTYNLVFVLVQTFDLSMDLSVVSANAE